MSQKTNKALLPALAVVFVVAGATVLLLSNRPFAGPPPTVTPIEGPVIDINFAHVDWAPETLVVAISPGETKTIDVKVKSSGRLPATIPQISPSLQPYLTISPATIPYFSGASEQTVHMTFSIPSGTAFQDIDGTVSLRTTKLTVAKTLPIRLHIWPSATGDSITVAYPPQLILDTNLLNSGWGVSLRNYDSEALPGIVIPWKGMLIEIVNTELPASLDEEIASDLSGALLLTNEPYIVNGFLARRVTFADPPEILSRQRGAVVYIVGHNSLTKAFLHYNEGDSDESLYLAYLGQIVEGLSIGP